MGKLIYLMITSLDGYVADKNGNFDWAMPSEEVHSFVNDIARRSGTSLLGRHMYDIMKVWDDIPIDDSSPAMNDYAKMWRTTSKIVYSTTLTDVTTTNTTIERVFDPVIVRQLITEADMDVDIGGPHLAAVAIRAGLVDEYHQVIAPQLVGGGTHWLPQDIEHTLQLKGTREFENGFVYLHYVKV